MSNNGPESEVAKQEEPEQDANGPEKGPEGLEDGDKEQDEPFEKGGDEVREHVAQQLEGGDLAGALADGGAPGLEEVRHVGCEASAGGLGGSRDLDAPEAAQRCKAEDEEEHGEEEEDDGIRPGDDSQRRGAELEQEVIRLLGRHA